MGTKGSYSAFTDPQNRRVSLYYVNDPEIAERARAAGATVRTERSKGPAGITTTYLVSYPMRNVIVDFTTPGNDTLEQRYGPGFPGWRMANPWNPHVGTGRRQVAPGTVLLWAGYNDTIPGRYDLQASVPAHLYEAYFAALDAGEGGGEAPAPPEPPAPPVDERKCPGTWQAGPVPAEVLADPKAEEVDDFFPGVCCWLPADTAAVFGTPRPAMFTRSCRRAVEPPVEPPPEPPDEPEEPPVEPPPEDGALRLFGGRFEVRVTFSAHDTTIPGTPVPLEPLTGSDESGYFYMLNSAGPDLTIKILDGRAANGYWWVFYGSLTDVAFELTVTDTLGGGVASYINPAKHMASRGDTTAIREAPPVVEDGP